MEDKRKLLEYLSRGFLDDLKPLPGEYYYASLPLCVVDAVFSIGIKYSQTEKVVQNVGRPLPLQVFREYGSPIPRNEQPTISEFLRLLGPDPERAAQTVFQDRHRTSATKGILKADAVMQFCSALASSGIERFADAVDDRRLNEARDRVRHIKGQGSGLSWGYFLMLAGDDRGVKTDRMVIRFVETAIGRKGVTPAEAEALVVAAADEIAAHGVPITPRQLDYIIWDFQRSRPRLARFGGEMLTAGQMHQFSEMIKNGTIPLSNKPGEDD